MSREATLSSWNGFWLVRLPRLSSIAQWTSRDDDESTNDLVVLFIDIESDLDVCGSTRSQQAIKSRKQFLRGSFWQENQKYVVRGELSPSLTLVEGATIHQAVYQSQTDPKFDSADISTPNAEATDCPPLVVSRYAPSKRVLDVSVALDDVPSASLAELFISPLTLQLSIGNSNGASSLRLAFDWKRLFHGVSTAPRVATRWLASPSLVCVRVKQDESTNSSTAKHLVASTVAVSASTSSMQPRQWRSALSTPQLDTSALLCQSATRMRKHSTIVVAPIDMCVSGMYSAENIRDESCLQHFTTIQHVSGTQFDENVVCGKYGAYWSLAGSESGTPVALGYRHEELRERACPHVIHHSTAALSNAGASLDPPISLLPVDDSLLVQLQCSKLRCCLADICILPTHHSAARCDDPLLWEVDDGGYFLRCSGTYSSINMAAMHLAAIKLPR